MLAKMSCLKRRANGMEVPKKPKRGGMTRTSNLFDLTYSRIDHTDEAIIVVEPHDTIKELRNQKNLIT